ncbi:MAG: transcription termination factor NusA [Christensenellaceae bacterium]|jgi:N utilization substance protein A|nr:transcription termination factor NusA [Christensenellaceae bacterium]
MRIKDFFSALNEIAISRNTAVEEIIGDLETALSAAFRRVYGEAKKARVEVNMKDQKIRFYSYKTVVADEAELLDSEIEKIKEEAKEKGEEVDPAQIAPFDYDKFITLSEARETDKNIKIGDVIEKEEKIDDFGRVAATAVKHVLNQKIKERSAKDALAEVEGQQDKIVTAKVLKFEGGKYFLELPNTSVQGIMDERNYIKEQTFSPNDMIKVYVPRLHEDNKFYGDIFVTRTRPEFVRALFLIEVPEFDKGELEIKGIAREAGYRTKIAVATNVIHVDPIGACVGAKGSRINNILSEIRPEKIDIIPWSEDPLEFIASALAPANVLRVEANEETRHARVVVPNDKLSLAIGKSGMNVRLAAKLTGWRIDVKSEEGAIEEDAKFIEEFDIGE